MTLSLIIALILVGIILILIEIFITPGIIVGTIGFILLGIGVYGGYSTLGQSTGNVILISTSVFVAIALYFSFRDGAWNRFASTDTIIGKANNLDQINVNVGDKGITISALRPTGTASINDQKVEVIADGDFIPANQAIEVIQRIDHKIFIQKINH
jgi:membrane-bound ClpP family serine protease